MFPVDQYRFENSNLGLEEYEDLRAVRIADNAVIRPNQRGFIDLWERPSKASAELYVCIGCPAYPDSIDYENPGINVVTHTFAAYPDTTYRSSARYVRRLTVSDNARDRVFYDGLSGGAVFALRGNLGSLSAEFEGMIIRGGAGFIYFISVEVLRLIARGDSTLN